MLCIHSVSSISQLKFSTKVRVFILCYTQTANDRSKFNVPRMESSPRLLPFFSSSSFISFLLRSFLHFLHFIMFLGTSALLYQTSACRLLFRLCGSWFCSSVTATKQTYHRFDCSYTYICVCVIVFFFFSFSTFVRRRLLFFLSKVCVCLCKSTALQLRICDIIPTS